MKQKTPHQKVSGKDSDRKDRMKAALKANMAKRKAQTKTRNRADDAILSSNKDKG